VSGDQELPAATNLRDAGDTAAGWELPTFDGRVVVRRSEYLDLVWCEYDTVSAAQAICTPVDYRDKDFDRLARRSVLVKHGCIHTRRAVTVRQRAPNPLPDGRGSELLMLVGAQTRVTCYKPHQVFLTSSHRPPRILVGELSSTS